MKFGKIVMFFLIFIGLLSTFLYVFSFDLSESEHLQDVSNLQPFTVEKDNHYNNPYFNALSQSMIEANINQFQLGEYGLNDRINFRDVYHLNFDIESEPYNDDMDNYEVEIIQDFFYNPVLWITQGIDETFGDLIDWDYGNMKNLSYNDDVFIYPHVYFNPEGMDLDRWFVVQTFSVPAYEPLDNWYRWEIWGGESYERIFKFDCGKMPNTDLYYVIDAVEIDRDIEFTTGFPFITPEENSNYAKKVERYGGVIHGENHLDVPTHIEEGGIYFDEDSSGFWNFLNDLSQIGSNFKILTLSQWGLIGTFMSILLIAMTGFITIMGIMFLIGTVRGVNLDDS